MWCRPFVSLFQCLFVWVGWSHHGRVNNRARTALTTEKHERLKRCDLLRVQWYGSWSRWVCPAIERSTLCGSASRLFDIKLRFVNFVRETEVTYARKVSRSLSATDTFSCEKPYGCLTRFITINRRSLERRIVNYWRGFHILLWNCPWYNERVCDCVTVPINRFHSRSPQATVSNVFSKTTTAFRSDRIELPQLGQKLDHW